jgi:hypothetical protein
VEVLVDVVRDLERVGGVDPERLPDVAGRSSQ